MYNCIIIYIYIYQYHVDYMIYTNPVYINSTINPMVIVITSGAHSVALLGSETSGSEPLLKPPWGCNSVDGSSKLRPRGVQHEWMNINWENKHQKNMF